ncbi:MAG: aspartate-semialdehyde dehydrogenase [candidate division WOR-3 bacterium]|nr:aspartate-semialdehyde dehydrogenase [candidate division WOR-3 bacterium]
MSDKIARNEEKLNVGIVGATGLVGETLIKVLEQRNFPVKRLILFSSEKSKGIKIKFHSDEIEVEPLTKESFKHLDLVFFAIEEHLAREWIPLAQKECLVIDKSSAFRLKQDVPLVVPEVNIDKIKEHKNLIANPNCTTIPLVIVLSPLHKAFGIKRVIVSTYQSVSGAGRDAINEFFYETEVLAVGEKITKDADSVFSAPIAGNIIPQIGSFDQQGYSSEEKKIIEETRKILELPKLAISATCVRVPVKIGHCESVNIELEKETNLDKVIRILKSTPSIKVFDDDKYPMPIDVENKDEVYVGRIRKDTAFENGIVLWLVCDNLRKGAATNAVQIAEAILKINAQTKNDND